MLRFLFQPNPVSWSERERVLPPDEQKRAEGRTRTMKKRFDSAHETQTMYELMTAMAASRE